jgi:predicted trehalose synthase
LAASETEQRVALAERVAELEAALASADDETASASAQAARFWRTNNKLAERVAELEAQLEEATQLLSIAIDRLPEEEQEIVALRWALSGTFTNELPTIAAPAPQEPTP